MDYVVEQKLIYAEQLLAKGDTKVYEAANFLGYHNVSYFIRIFRKKYGYTPKKYLDMLELIQEESGGE